MGLWLLLCFERRGQGAVARRLAVFGAAPMFFYLLLYLACVAAWGPNHGQYFGFDSVPAVWLCALVLIVALYPPVRWFARLKARRRDTAWLKYL